VEWDRDGVDGSIIDVMDGVNGYAWDDYAWSETRAMTATEIARFADAIINVGTPIRFFRELDQPGEYLFDLVTDFPDDYAITGIKVVSSLGRDVDIIIKIYDVFDGVLIETIDEDQILLFGTVFESEPAVEVGLDSIADELVVAYGHKLGEGIDGWTVYEPAYPAEKTLETLYVGRGYWLNVSGACTLEYGDHSIPLDAGWNLIGWLGY